MTRPARTLTCAQVTLAEAADTLETSPVEVEVMPGVGKIMLLLVYLFIGIFYINSHVKSCVPGAGQFVGDEVTVVVSVTVAAKVTHAGVDPV